jgi:hypothetical protein
MREQQPVASRWRSYLHPLKSRTTMVAYGLGALALAAGGVGVAAAVLTRHGSIPPRMVGPAPLLSPTPVAPSATPAATPSAPSSPIVGPCLTSNLAVTMGRANGAAGSIGTIFRVRNASTAVCTLVGYFGLDLLDSAGHRVGQVPSRDPGLEASSPVAGPIRLGPGDTAGFSLLWGNNNAVPGPCPQASQVELTAPDQYDHVFIPAMTADGITIAPCGNGYVDLGPVTPGPF